jgi:hypothetical protein
MQRSAGTGSGDVKPYVKLRVLLGFPGHCVLGRLALANGTEPRGGAEGGAADD